MGCDFHHRMELSVLPARWSSLIWPVSVSPVACPATVNDPTRPQGLQQCDSGGHLLHLQIIQNLLVGQHCGLGNQHVGVSPERGMARRTGSDRVSPNSRATTAIVTR